MRLIMLKHFDITNISIHKYILYVLHFLSIILVKLVSL